VRKDIFPSQIIQFCLLILTDLQAEYPEFFEFFLTLFHMWEHSCTEIKFCKLFEFLDCFLKG
jgi:hypothetical protein